MLNLLLLLQGITKPAIRRLAWRGGVKDLLPDYEETRGVRGLGYAKTCSSKAGLQFPVGRI